MCVSSFWVEFFLPLSLSSTFFFLLGELTIRIEVGAMVDVRNTSVLSRRYLIGMTRPRRGTNVGGFQPHLQRVRSLDPATIYAKILACPERAE